MLRYIHAAIMGGLGRFDGMSESVAMVGESFLQH